MSNIEFTITLVIITTITTSTSLQIRMCRQISRLLLPSNNSDTTLAADHALYDTAIRTTKHGTYDILSILDCSIFHNRERVDGYAASGGSSSTPSDIPTWIQCRI